MNHTGIIALNGKVMEAGDALISPFDRALWYGDAVFETLVAFGTKILCLNEHLHRLRWSGSQQGIQIPWSDAELQFELEALCAEVPAPKKMLRLLVSRGGDLGLQPTPNDRPNRLVMVSPARIEPERSFVDGLSLKRIARGYTRRGPQPKVPSIYAEAIPALQRARSEGYDDILWTNADNEIQESSHANIVFIGREGDLVEISTPSPHTGILVGTTRVKLFELLQSARIPASEKIVFTEEIPRFDEAFLCSSVRGLVPIARIDNHKLQTLRRDSTFKHIERLFFTWFTCEIGQKLDWNTGLRNMSVRPSGNFQ